MTIHHWYLLPKWDHIILRLKKYIAWIGISIETAMLQNAMIVSSATRLRLQKWNPKEHISTWCSERSSANAEIEWVVQINKNETYVTLITGSLLSW